MEPNLSNPVGSAYYMSPELLKRNYSAPTDIWSTGILTYILLCGYAPFNGDDDDEIFNAILRGHFDFPERRWMDKSPLCIDFIKCLLRRDPRKRYTAQEALMHPWIVDMTSKDILWCVWFCHRDDNFLIWLNFRQNIILLIFLLYILLWDHVVFVVVMNDTIVIVLHWLLRWQRWRKCEEVKVDTTVKWSGEEFTASFWVGTRRLLLCTGSGDEGKKWSIIMKDAAGGLLSPLGPLTLYLIENLWSWCWWRRWFKNASLERDEDDSPHPNDLIFKAIPPTSFRTERFSWNEAGAGVPWFWHVTVVAVSSGVRPSITGGEWWINITFLASLCSRKETVHHVNVLAAPLPEKRKTINGI